MNVVAIIQARMSSSRLPHKVMLDIQGQPMLARVIERARAAETVDDVVVATSADATDDAIAAFCLDRRVGCYRGSLDDVLNRYVEAMTHFDADVCIRICADCPLLDPGVVDRVVKNFLSANPRVDYASNKIGPTFPMGMDVEVFTRAAIERADRAAVAFYQRSHVTPFIYEHPYKFTLLRISDECDRSEWRLTVDTPADLELVRTIYRRLGASQQFGLVEIATLFERDPSLPEMNRHVQAKALVAG